MTWTTKICITSATEAVGLSIYYSMGITMDFNSKPNIGSAISPSENDDEDVNEKVMISDQIIKIMEVDWDVSECT